MMGMIQWYFQIWMGIHETSQSILQFVDNRVQ